MARRVVQIDDEVRSVMAKRITVLGPKVLIDGQLDRPLYDKVNKVLVALGGKWNKSARAHVFDVPNAGAVIASALSDGEVVDQKKTLEQFFTPPELAETVVGKLVDELGPLDGKLVLEPSAGHGALALVALREGASVCCVEKDPDTMRRLNENLKAAGYHGRGRVFYAQADFMEASLVKPFPDGFDGVLMNPPFSRDQDVRHVMKAFDALKPGGALVAIMSPRFTFVDNKACRGFLALVKKHGLYWENPEGSFRESGTEVRTLLVVLRKPSK